MSVNLVPIANVNEAMELIQFLQNLQAVQTRLAIAKKVSFSFVDAIGATPAFNDATFITAFQSFLAGQITAVTSRIEALGIAPPSPPNP